MEASTFKHKTEVANKQFALGISALAIIPMLICALLDLALSQMLLVGATCALLTLIISLLAPPVSMGDEFNTTAFMIAAPYAATLLALMLFDIEYISIISALTIALSINSAALLIHILRCWYQHPDTMFH